MRTIVFVLMRLFLVGVVLGAVAGILGPTWVILLVTAAAIWFVRAATSGRLDEEKLKAILGLKKRAEEDSDEEQPPEDGEDIP